MCFCITGLGNMSDTTTWIMRDCLLLNYSSTVTCTEQFFFPLDWDCVYSRSKKPFVPLQEPSLGGWGSLEGDAEVNWPRPCTCSSSVAELRVELIFRLERSIAETSCVLFVSLAWGLGFFLNWKISLTIGNGTRKFEKVLSDCLQWKSFDGNEWPSLNSLPLWL